MLTVVQNWSYRAYGSIFKAIREAGFNKSVFPTLQDMILVTEPEAASCFTARDNLEQRSDFLKVSDEQC